MKKDWGKISEWWECTYMQHNLNKSSDYPSLSTHTKYTQKSTGSVNRTPKNHWYVQQKLKLRWLILLLVVQLPMKNKTSRKITGFWFNPNNRNKSIYHSYVSALGKNNNLQSCLRLKNKNFAQLNLNHGTPIWKWIARFKFYTSFLKRWTYI